MKQRRRDLLQWSATAVLASACSRRETKTEPPAPTPLPDTGIVRVASVPTAVEGNLLPSLVADFERSSGLRVELVASTEAYDVARAGKADLVISHYGHRHTEDFVIAGLGAWPRTLFSNQMALLGPRSDPAKVRGLADAVEAFRRIAQTRSAFVLNDIEGVRYLTDILWNAAGCPDRAGWLLDDRTTRKDGAIALAVQKSAYVFWGLTPFLRQKENALEPLVVADPLLQRMLVSVVVEPAKVPGANADGARRLEAYLLAPATQARMRSTRYPGETAVTWLPAGRHNRTGFLPKG